MRGQEEKMSFIAKHIVGSDERVVTITRLHWIYAVKGLMWFLFLAGFGFAADWGIYFISEGSGPIVSFSYIPFWLQFHAVLALFLATGILVLWVYVIKLLSTEIVLTNKRVVYKRGLIFVEVEEISLDEISSETVNHGFLGSFLSYGTIFLDMRFVGDVHLPTVKDPYNLVKGINRMRGALHAKPIL